MTIVAALLVPGSPLPQVARDNPPWGALAKAYEAAGAALAQAAPETATERVRGHIARIVQSPAPGYKAYADDLVRQGCAQFAQLHNSTTREQRANAVRVLKGYEDDLRVLSAQR